MTDANALTAARAVVAAKRAERGQMREDWGHHREPEEVLADEVDRLEAERDRLRTELTQERDEHKVTWGDWKQQRERAEVTEGERDRLRGDTETWQKRSDGYRTKMDQIAAERDRLRAVVDGLRGYLSLQDVGEEPSEVFDELRAILAELAEGAETTDG